MNETFKILVMSTYSEAAAWRCFRISKNSQVNTCARVSFLIKLQGSTCNFIKKETLAEVFSRELCKISTNTFPYRTKNSGNLQLFILNS